MGGLVTFVRSSIGAKVFMALSGAAMFGFVLVHMLGNLQVYLGPEPYNAYAAFLKGTPELLWAARAVLLGSVAVHVASGLRLAALNRAARPHDYVAKRFTKASMSSRTMVLSGLVVLSFIVYHLLHFTLGVTDPAHYHLVDSHGRHDVYAMFVHGFRNPYVSVSYIVAMTLLGAHLHHGVTSLFQTLGFNGPRFSRVIELFGPSFAAIVVLGNVSMPISVMMGWLTLPAGGVG